ncbi:hypothetical protein AMAG_10499 [Allomyces macrogynus ATCC 38327]|uniref:Uncharacterized protein n=1 Tax=Allomyces macrogynus (strain ATCC 38327) TaxID=578462 RepID=A0A0L0SV51_ALLM3|nr:hypothetical protein AMAG_10499 [Allomyces macrogynus ATCC 38327]|eukprot:KNE66265.1 hypothetical protein AMAG_10499 [Allomyces macrogynus ATCC 38327]
MWGATTISLPAAGTPVSTTTPAPPTPAMWPPPPVSATATPPAPPAPHRALSLSMAMPAPATSAPGTIYMSTPPVAPATGSGGNSGFQSPATTALPFLAHAATPLVLGSPVPGTPIALPLGAAAVSAQLAQIQGQIAHANNAFRAIHRVACLGAHSTSLEQWLAALPAHLRFSFTARRAESPFALHLNLIYYLTVLTLYRPFLVDPVPDGGLAALPNVTNVCMTTVKAILYILQAAHSDGVLPALSMYVPHAVHVLTVTLYLVWRNAAAVPANPRELVEYLTQAVQLNEGLPLWT